MKVSAFSYKIRAIAPGLKNLKLKSATMYFKHALLFLVGSLLFLMVQAQEDTVMVTIAADTLSSDQQEGGISVKALEFYNTGLASYENNDLESAIQNFTEAVAAEPNFAKAIYNRSAAYVKLKRYEEAIADYDQFILLLRQLGF